MNKRAAALVDSRYCSLTPDWKNQYSLEMELALVAVSLVLSLAACGVSLTLFLHKESIHDITARQRAVELELADIADRLATWQRRDASRARKVAGPTADDGGGLFPDQHGAGHVPTGAGKSALRLIARQRGMIK